MMHSDNKSVSKYSKSGREQYLIKKNHEYQFEKSINGHKENHIVTRKDLKFLQEFTPCSIDDDDKNNIGLLISKFEKMIEIMPTTFENDKCSSVVFEGLKIIFAYLFKHIQIPYLKSSGNTTLKTYYENKPGERLARISVIWQTGVGNWVRRVYKNTFSRFDIGDKTIRICVRDCCESILDEIEESRHFLYMGYNTYNPMREYSENNEYRFHFKDHWPFDLEKERAWVGDHNLEEKQTKEINLRKNNLLERMLSMFVIEYIYCYGPCFDRDFENKAYNVLVNANNDRLCDGNRCTNENLLEKWEETQQGKKPTLWEAHAERTFAQAFHRR
jgi:hypothetical protein